MAHEHIEKAVSMLGQRVYVQVECEDEFTAWVCGFQAWPLEGEPGEYMVVLMLHHEYMPGQESNTCLLSEASPIKPYVCKSC